MLEDAELAVVPSVDQQVELALAVGEPDVVWPALVDVLEHRDAWEDPPREEERAGDAAGANV